MLTATILVPRIALTIAAASICTWAVGEEHNPPPRPAQERLRLAFVPPEPAALPQSADPGGTADLTLADVESIAQARHPALRQAAGQLQAARGNWLQVGLRPNPEVGYSGSEIGNEGQAGQQGGYVSQEFVTANKLGLSRAVAAREVAAAEQRVRRMRLQVILSVRLHYFECLAAERSVALARQLNEIAAQSVQVSELRLKALDIPRSSLLQSQIESESAALLEQQANLRREAAWKRLAVTIGVERRDPNKLEDVFQRPLPEFDWDTVRDELMSRSPELAELRFNVERARWAVERASAGRVPNVSVQAGAAFDDATRDTIANVQIGVPLPVFDRKQGAIAQACGELTAAQAALRTRELALEQQLAAALRDYTTAGARVARYAESILPAARETLNITNAGYRQGELDYLQVLSVQQTYARAHFDYLQSLETAWKSWAQIDGLLVDPLPANSN